jgi:hypothetical protein
MNNQSKSKATGELNGVEEKQRLAMQSSSEEKTKITLATLESSQSPKNQIGFQPTKPLELDEETTNAKLVVTFAAKLGALVVWKKLELADGTEVIALCFPTNSWTTNATGELVTKR